MAYPKITVNTGLVLDVIASDTIPIPSPDLPKISGTTTASTTNKLVDVGADFSTVSVGDIVYNTTDNTIATVTEVETSTILVISANIFTSSENYIIFLGGPNGSKRSNGSEGCLLYVANNVQIFQDIQPTDPVTPGIGTPDPRYVNVRVKSVAGNDVVFKNFKVGNYLPIQITQLYATQSSNTILTNCLAIW